jgi:preprotein translocase subunit YajC
MFYNLQNPVNYLMPILNVLHLESDKERNEKINNPMMTLILVAFFEQVRRKCIYNRNCYCHFMFGMMQLSAKTPSKNQDNQDKEEKMFNKGDKVSVLDEAINGVVISTKDKEVTIETEDGFMMTFLVNEILKVNDTSNLMDSIKRINRDEIEKEKRSETKFCQRAQR